MTDTGDGRDAGEVPGDRGVYAISVAAELSGLGMQSLRLFERHGLLTPARTDGGTRRYSADDLERLRRIAELQQAGVNLAGIARILDLEDHNARLESDLDGLRADAARRENAPGQATGQDRVEE